MIDFFLSIFAPWLVDPTFDRATWRRPYPRVCLGIAVTAIGFIAGAIGAAIVGSRCFGGPDVTASTICGVLLATGSLALVVWIFRRTNWLEG